MERKLSKVKVGLRPDGWKVSIEQGAKGIRKKSIGVPSDGKMLNTHLPFYMQTSCYEGEEEQAINALKKIIYEKFMVEYDRVTTCYKNIINLPKPQ